MIQFFTIFRFVMQQAECFFIQTHFLQWGGFLIFASLYGYGIYLFILIFIHPVM